MSLPALTTNASRARARQQAGLPHARSWDRCQAHDGDLITSAGVSAGIDMALHLISRLAGSERGSRIRRDIQYEPEAA